MGLSDYAQALGVAQSLVPNWRQGDIDEARLANERQALVGQRLQQQGQAQALQYQAQDRQYANERRNSFTSALQGLGDNPTVDAYHAMAIKYPEFAKPLQSAADSLTAENREKAVRYLAPIQALVSGGDYDAALKQVQRHIDADKSAGREPDESDVELRDALSSGDPKQQKAAGGVLFALMTQFNPETAAKNIGEYGGGKGSFAQLGSGGLYNTATGEVTREPSREPKYEVVKNADGTSSVVQLEGGDPSSGGAGGASSGTSALSGNNPGGINDGAFARSQPGYVGANGRFAGFRTLQDGVNAQKALLRSYISRGYDTPAKIAARWAPSGDGSNDPNGYASNIASMLGIGVNDKLTANDVDKLQNAQARQENAMYPQAMSRSGTPDNSGGAHVVYTSQGGGDVASDYKPGTTVGGLSGDAIDRAAQLYNATGKLPASLGRRGDVQRAILSRAAQLAEGVGVGDQIADQSSRSADIAALKTLQKNSANVLAFERTALHNAATATRLAARVGEGGAPIVNKWINAGRRSTGDGDIAAFDAAVETFTNEYAKVVSSATGGGTTSDSAREHARSMLNTAQSPAQFAQVTNTLVTDMENRKRGLASQRDEIMGRIRGGGSQQSSGGLPQGAHPIGTYQGKMVYQLPDGRRVVAQ